MAGHGKPRRRRRSGLSRRTARLGRREVDEPHFDPLAAVPAVADKLSGKMNRLPPGG